MVCVSLFLKSRPPALEHQDEGGDVYLGGLLRGLCFSVFEKQTASTRPPGREGDVHLGGLLRGLMWSVFLCFFKKYDEKDCL